MLVAVVVLTACGGGGGGSTPAPISNASPGGIWQGTDSITGLSIYGIITESGEFRFLRADGSQYFGTVTTSGNNISGSFGGILPAGSFYADGSNHGTGTISGTIEARQTISATIGFTTAGGTSSSGTISLTFNPLYDSGSSLATVAGDYLDSVNNAIIRACETITET
jgi:hypothetical protein